MEGVRIAGGRTVHGPWRGWVGLPGKNLSFSRGDSAKESCTALTDGSGCS